MPLNVEYFSDRIAEELFSDDELITRGNDDSIWVEGTAVNKPQSGSGIVVVKDRNTYPATAVRRTDANLRYTLHEFTTNPSHIPDAEESVTNYNKAVSIIGQHTKTIREQIGDYVLTEWAGGAVFRTSGAADDNGKSQIVISDIIDVAKRFDIDKVPMKDRFLVMTPTLYYQLFGIDALIKMDVMGKTSLPTGVVNQLLGFNILMRPRTVIYTNAVTPLKVAYDTAKGAEDNEGIIAFQKEMVCYAKGEIKLFENVDDALYYGSVYSTLVRLGAAKERTDEKGVAVILQKDAA